MADRQENIFLTYQFKGEHDDGTILFKKNTFALDMCKT